MKIKILNIISGILFLISSLSLLAIPFLNLDERFPAEAYVLAGLFWFGLINGMVLQIIISVVCKKLKKPKKKRLHIIIGIVFLISLLSIIPVFLFFTDNEFILPINLSIILLSAEMYFVVKRMECL